MRVMECPVCGRTANRRGEPFENKQSVRSHIGGSHDDDHTHLSGYEEDLEIEEVEREPREVSVKAMEETDETDDDSDDIEELPEPDSDDDSDDATTGVTFSKPVMTDTSDDSDDDMQAGSESSERASDAANEGAGILRTIVGFGVFTLVALAVDAFDNDDEQDDDQQIPSVGDL